MTSTAWTLPIPANRVQEFRYLLGELNAEHLPGLGIRAREVGYNRGADAFLGSLEPAACCTTE